MAMLANLSVFKVLGIFGTMVILVLFLGGTGIGIAKAVKTGDWRAGLSESGGRIFSIDASLNEETNYLLDPENDDNVYLKIFHIMYALTLIFVLFFVAFALFKIFNWAIGIKQFSPSSDIIIIALIVLIVLLLQFLYTHFILHQDLVPMSGVWRFVSNFPQIVNRMI